MVKAQLLAFLALALMQPLPAGAAETAEEPDVGAPQVTVRAIDGAGSPLAGTKLYRWHVVMDGNERGNPWVCDANGQVSLPRAKVFQYAYRGEASLYGLYEDRLAGFADVNASNADSGITICLTPACRVHGNFRSSELKALGQEVTWTNVYVERGQERPLMCASRRGEFSFLLPSGRHELYAYGLRLYGRRLGIEIAEGQNELKMDVNLPADRIAHLIGKEAPPLTHIKGWINTWRGLKLSRLRGKVVLLDFWGTWCGPCVQGIPKLIDLHEKYSRRGLVIIGIHNDSLRSAAELKRQIAALSAKYWNGRKIPFAIALDGGGRCPVEGTNWTASGATTAAYGINGFPTMLLIDKRGKVVGEYDGNDVTLEQLLAERQQ